MKLKIDLAGRLVLRVLFVLMAGSIFSSANGQEAPVRVEGVVVDWQYARVLSTTIVFESEVEKKAVKVSDEGAYEIELPPGRYVVKAIAPGFIERRIKLQLDTTSHRVLNLLLNVQPQKRTKCPKGSLCL